MGIGDSKGAFHEDAFQHEAAPWFMDPKLDNNVIDPEIDPGSTTPVKGGITPVSDHTGFRQSDNIDDQRDTPYSLSQQWDDQVAVVQQHFNDLMTHPLTRTVTPVDPGDPDSPLAKEAGVDNIGSQPFAAQNTLTDYLLQQVGRETTVIKDFATAAKNVWRGYDDNFNTILGSDEEEKFADWKKKNAPNDSGVDYDLRGAFKEGLSRSTEDQHLPDTYKKPNHPTFSDQSKYAKDAPDLAGSWDGDTFIPPALK